MLKDIKALLKIKESTLKKHHTRYNWLLNSPKVTLLVATVIKK